MTTTSKYVKGCHYPIEKFKKEKEFRQNMLIIHENLQEEANDISEVCKKTIGIRSELRNENLEKLFIPLPKVGGYYEGSAAASPIIGKGNGIRAFLGIKDKHIIVVTLRDLYYEDSADCWIFGCTPDGVITVSTSRLKRQDSFPSTVLSVPKQLYTKRLVSIAVHEIGHIIVQNPRGHFQPAVWEEHSVRQDFGYHCPDNSCVMYQVGEIRAPLPEQGFMWVGSEKRYDAGLDDVIERRGEKWFCDKCQSSIHIEDDF